MSIFSNGEAEAMMELVRYVPWPNSVLKKVGADVAELSDNNPLRPILDHDVLVRSPFDSERFFRELTHDIGHGQTIALVNACLKIGGYISGGMATAMHGVEHENQHRSQRNNYLIKRYGDIDVFFENPAHMADAITMFRAADFEMLETKNSFLCTNNRLKVQLIKCRYLQPAGMFKTFDISNACVAFTSTECIRARFFDELVRSKLLHVQQWNDLTAARVKKWFRKHSPRFMKLHWDNNEEFMRRVHAPSPEGNVDEYEFF